MGGIPVINPQCSGRSGFLVLVSACMREQAWDVFERSLLASSALAQRFSAFSFFCSWPTSMAVLILFNYNTFNIYNKYVLYQHGCLYESVSNPLDVNQAIYSMGTYNYLPVEFL